MNHPAWWRGGSKRHQRKLLSILLSDLPKTYYLTEEMGAISVALHGEKSELVGGQRRSRATALARPMMHVSRSPQEKEKQREKFGVQNSDVDSPEEYHWARSWMGGPV